MVLWHTSGRSLTLLDIRDRMVFPMWLNCKDDPVFYIFWSFTQADTTEEYTLLSRNI